MLEPTVDGDHAISRRSQAELHLDKYYLAHHLPIVARWPKIKRIVISKGQPDDALYQMAELYFDSRMEMEAALRSPERALAAEDAKKLPRFSGEVKRRTFEVTDFVKE